MPASSFQSAAPALVFLALNQFAGLRWAVVAATVTSFKVLVDRRRSGAPLGRFMPLLTVAIVGRGILGAATGSETLYFGLGIGAKFAAAAVLLGSVVAGRPLAAYAARRLLVLPEGADRHRSFRSTMAIVTTIAGVYYATSAAFDVWLFGRSSVQSFVLVRLVANWPFGLVAVGTIALVARRGLRRVPGLAPLETLIEQRFGTGAGAASDTGPPPQQAGLQ